MQDYEKTYDEFWKEIIEKNGVVDIEQVKKELHDYHFILGEVPKVYCHVTGSRVSKPNTFASDVISEADEYTNEMIEQHEKDLLADGWKKPE